MYQAKGSAPHPAYTSSWKRGEDAEGQRGLNVSLHNTHRDNSSYCPGHCGQRPILMYPRVVARLPRPGPDYTLPPFRHSIKYTSFSPFYFPHLSSCTIPTSAKFDEGKWWSSSQDREINFCVLSCAGHALSASVPPRTSFDALFSRRHTQAHST